MRAFIAFVFVFVLGACPLHAATYYIDITAGADTNNGTAKATPWKHFPGMPTCTNTCAATTPAAGDSFILKGGETWGTTGASRVGNVITGAGRTANARPNGSAWDIGAYQYRASNGSIRGSKGLGLY